jgi:hypothetical protein
MSSQPVVTSQALRSRHRPDVAPRLSWRLLARYLGPAPRAGGLLAAILAVTIAVQLAAPLVAGRFVDAAAGSGGRLVTLAVLTIALAVVGQGAAVAETWVAERLAWGTTNVLRESLAAHVLGLDAAFHAAHRPGELIERVDGDVGTVARLFSRFAVNVVGNALLILGILGLLVALDWRIGLALTLFAGVALAAMLRLRAAATPRSAVERQAAANVYGFLVEYLAGLEDVRASDARPFVLRRYAGLMRAWLSAKTRAGMYGYGIVATSQGLFGLGTAVALALAAAHHRDGGLTIGAVFLVFRYTRCSGSRPSRSATRSRTSSRRPPASAGSSACSPSAPPGRRAARRPAGGRPTAWPPRHRPRRGPVRLPARRARPARRLGPGGAGPGARRPRPDGQRQDHADPAGPALPRPDAGSSAWAGSTSARSRSPPVGPGSAW